MIINSLEMKVLVNIIMIPYKALSIGAKQEHYCAGTYTRQLQFWT